MMPFVKTFFKQKLLIINFLLCLSRTSSTSKIVDMEIFKKIYSNYLSFTAAGQTHQF